MIHIITNRFVSFEDWIRKTIFKPRRLGYQGATTSSGHLNGRVSEKDLEATSGGQLLIGQGSSLVSAQNRVSNNTGNRSYGAIS
jgi:hypothetical protein